VLWWCDSGAGVPVEDQQLAVALLMELAVQHGGLSDMLSAVRLLLDISSDVVDVDRDNRLSSALTHAPLVPVLQRFQALVLSCEARDSGDVSEVICYPLCSAVLSLRNAERERERDREIVVSLDFSFWLQFAGVYL